MWVSLVAFLQVALASAGRNETKNPAVSWLMEGGNVERTGSLQGSPGIAGASWEYTVDSGASVDGDYASIALANDKGCYKSFNPRGPILVDAVNDSCFISWTGSAQAAGLQQFSDNGTLVFKSNCPKSESYSYDVGPIAADAAGHIYASCSYFESLSRLNAVQTPGRDGEQFGWTTSVCSMKLAPMVVHMRFRNTDGGHNERDIGIFGGCTSLRRLQGIDIATGDMVLQIRTPSMATVDAVVATAMLEPRGDNESPVLFMLAADSRLCAYRLNTTLDAGPVTKPVEVPYVSCIYFEPAPPLSANRQPIDLGKIVVDAASSTVFVQGRHASFRNGPAGYWNLGAVKYQITQETVTEDSEERESEWSISMEVLWNVTQRVEGSSKKDFIDTSNTMTLSLGSLDGTPVVFTLNSEEQKLHAINIKSGPKRLDPASGREPYEFSQGVKKTPSKEVFRFCSLTPQFTRLALDTNLVIKTPYKTYAIKVGEPVLETMLPWVPRALVTDALGNLYATGLIWKSGSKTFIKKWNTKDLKDAFTDVSHQA